MTGIALWCLTAVLHGASPDERSTPVIVLLPASSTTASVAAAYLENELGRSLRREIVKGLDAEQSLRDSSVHWSDAILVLLHPERNETWMLRPGDRAPVVRRLIDPPESPAYPLAIAAAELVRNAVSRPEPEPGPPIELAFSIGLGVSSTPGFEGTFAQPVFGADLRVGAGGLWSSAGLRVRGPSTSGGDAPSATIINYDRTDLALRLSIGPDLDLWVLSALLEAGVSVVSVEALSEGEVLGSNTRWPFWLGLGAELRRPLALGFGVFLCVGLVHVFSPADFTGEGEVLFSEGTWRLQSHAGLEWAL